MALDFEQQYKIMNDYIHGLEQEIRLKTEIIEAQKEMLTRSEEYIHRLTGIIDDFPSLVEGVRE